MTRFKAAYVSGTYRTGGPDLPVGALPVERRPALFTALPVPVVYAAPDPAHVVAARTSAEDDALADTVLDVIVRRLEGQGLPAHQVWLPPLDRGADAGPAAAGARADRGPRAHARRSTRGRAG